MTDSAGKKTTYYYDFTNRLMKYVESGNGHDHAVSYEYDDINNLTKLVQTIQGTQTTTGYTYDLDNRVTGVTSDSASRSYSYDGFSRIQNRVTSHGTSPVLTESLNYRTVNGAATGQIASFHSDSAGNHDVTYAYTYDGNGNILSISDGSSTTSYVYDSANQLTRENNQAAGKTWVWDYDDAGNILSRTEYAYTAGDLPTNAEATVSYGYNDASWGDLLTSYNGQAITYDTIGNPLRDGTWTYTWEHGRQLAQMTNTDDPNKEISVTYTYDANGLRTGMTVTTKTYHSHSYTSVVTAPTCTTRGYTTYTCACGDSYTDSQTAATGHRNTSTVITEPTCTQRGVIRHTCTVCGNVSATYSPALGHVPGTGINRLKCDRCGETIGSGGGGGEITPVDPPITPIDPTVPIQSTETGTMEPQSTDNGDDRILVSEQVVECEYFYTGDKLTYMTQSTQVDDGEEEIIDLWFYYDASGTPYALKYQDEYFYYATNAQGDVTGILNSSGNEIAAYTYDAWGNPLAASGTHALANLNPLRYRGYVYDFETELYYLQSRYYNPEVGRFLNADAYASTGQGMIGNNMFAYCGNNPVCRIDTAGTLFTDIYGIAHGEEPIYMASKKPKDWVSRKDPRKGSNDRQPTNERERNKKHPDGEEHSRIPKGNGSQMPKHKMVELPQFGVITVYPETVSAGLCLVGGCMAVVVYVFCNDSLVDTSNRW